MDKLKMLSMNKVGENIKKIGELFPNALTEVIKGYREDGTSIIEHAIDFDLLRQELSDVVVEGSMERYQFTWPEKKKSILLANAPIAKTLRPFREDSVNFEHTENLYIEGDNLDALKLLQETYLGKVQMIYIDPPYNTGNDFLYEDDFAQDIDEYLANSGQYDDVGNRLVQNAESNGRFHTDWLNMMYPRLKLAKDLLSDDGVIFISIGDEEVDNLRKICDEIFGEANFRNQIIVRRGAKSVQAQFKTWEKLGQGFEYLLFYTKNANYRFPRQMKPLDEKREGTWNNHWRGTDRPTMRFSLFGIIPESGQWRWGKERSEKAVENYNRMLKELGETEETIRPEQIDKWLESQTEDIDLLRLSKNGKPEHYIPPTNYTLLNSSWNDLLVGSSSEITNLFETKVFDTAKLTSVITRILNFVDKDANVLDFFSGSATTAHAVMKLNAEDGGNRKFIMVQLPEETDEKTEAYKAGYKNICEIGKERIRRVGKKLIQEHPEVLGKLDIGFRVLKVDSTNMQDVYYSPAEYSQDLLLELEDNIKPDRTPEDLLFQVMLDLGILLSSKIEETVIGNKKVFNVAEGYLIACFDSNVSSEVITEIAKNQPYYAVFRDSGIASDSVATNFEQIFETYSPITVRKVL
ncbi:site-specific DNA-methyltransferase [Bacillus sp. AFS076308]|uniref:site-specific DNA-methyltransferase n=1 Tax=Bacillus sp. AFS076308 TaxID=2033512 RepID=UPI000BF96BDC|nr:site-specific DNA-methyltransferase [Bacillus sp. AFS076308]PFO04680.1 site-specific DNA-methyltransferase [Bacillus sp. AFS076308]